MTRRSEDNPDIALAMEVVSVEDGTQAQARATKAVEKVWEQRLAEVRKERHNTVWGRVALAVATALAIGLVFVLFFTTSCHRFDAIAKFVPLALTTLVTIVLLREDPFHEGLGPNAGYLDRLKVQGKLIAMVAAVGLVFGVLGLIASNRVQELERTAINGTATATLEKLKALNEEATNSLQKLNKEVGLSTQRLDDLKKQSKDLREQSEELKAEATKSLQKLNREVGLSIQRLDDLKKQSEELRKQSEELKKVDGVLAKLDAIPRKSDLLEKQDLIQRLDSLPTRNSFDKLPTNESLVNIMTKVLEESEWGKQVVKTKELEQVVKTKELEQTLRKVLAEPRSSPENQAQTRTMP